ncbi:TetR family transcriptional regulator [Variovorax ginsengisoli]|uniref:TetR/AcrR family acrAB operon transcriptional repressor n=1 Tax=Variovorax ginsengisoli TaxID=363844 RepID=A0ABT9SA97_9BURK|nr:TetR family transcriptional regulator [Variovorax ginsengisoli]MDP9901288.1 TetR/AcrR family acrAB operon transcriptional repressor [Variovorax ginsengisoli]
MARRTKEEALATRHRLIDAAELLFQAHGVSRTSLQQIAEKAGATRGAVYWHFKNKADLFNAMMERVTLPLETAAHEAGKADLDPLGQIEQVMVEALRLMTKDAQVRRVFEVATHKVEYTDEMQSVQQRHLDVRNVCIQDFERAMRLAARRERIQPTIPTASAALGMHALVSGLIQEWLLDPDAFDLVAAGRQTFGAYLMGLGFPRPAAVPADGSATRQEVAKVPLPGAPR